MGSDMYVIGTAGHVDHGKSTLVEALTGIDPDRLQEEKERGMTIDLGFAWLELPNGEEVSIVDVPGHERFVNNMLAGVGGIDLAMLVIAADESVMPQTREHLAILDLLKISIGVVVLTKIDMVSDEWIELVGADIEDALRETSLEGSEIYPVSALKGTGISELLLGIQNLIQDSPQKRDVGRPRLPIDRAFTITGFGTVVTGTLIDGSLAVGQEVELATMGQFTRVRGLQTHLRKQEEVLPGTRVAANLIGVSQDEILRGEVLTVPGLLSPTEAVDVRLRVIPDSPQQLRHNMYLTLHTGSVEVVARLRLLDKDVVEPGDDAWAQLKLDKPIVVMKGDYFVVRSNQTTLGGGRVIETHAQRHRRRHAPTIERLALMDGGTDAEVILTTVDSLEPGEFDDVVKRTNMNAQTVSGVLEAMLQDDMVVILDNANIGSGSLIYSKDGWVSVGIRTKKALYSYHNQFPLRRGAPKEELRSRLEMTQMVFNLALPLLEKEAILVEQGALVKLPDHKPALTDSQTTEASTYLALLVEGCYSPSTERAPDAELLNFLVDEHKVIKLNDNVVYAVDVYSDMVVRVSEFIGINGQITVADVRDLFNTSRKYAIALLDHMDQRRITRRIGDARVLR